MHVSPFHQAKHLARHAAHLQCFAVERSGERIQGTHDVCDRSKSVEIRSGCGSLLSLIQHAGICLLHHLFAEIHADEIVLENIVVEHVLSGFAEVYDPLREGWRSYAECHVLGIRRAGGVVIATDPANAAGDEVRIARILSLHKDAVAAKDRRRAVALGDLSVFEIDFAEDSKPSVYPGDWIPVDLH